MPTEQDCIARSTLTFLNYVFAPDDIVELRTMLKDSTVVAGRFTDFEKMAAVAADVDSWPQTASVYFTLNPIAPERAKYVGDFSANIIRSKVRTTRDADVLCRNTHLVDLDPVRPSGVCSTDREKAEASSMAMCVKAHLTEQGWPEPIVLDSGNGYHLLYRGDRCSTLSKDWAYALKHLAKLFSTESVKVDTSVANPARISRLPGTFNRKGDNTAERPHRRSRVVSYPKEWSAVPHDKIAALAVNGYHAPLERIERQHQHGSSGSTENPEQQRNLGRCCELVADPEGAIEDWVAEFPDQLEIAGTFERDGVKYFALRECPFAGRAHTGAVGKTAIILSDTSVAFHCFSDDCVGKGMRELREHLHSLTGRWSKVRFYERTTSHVGTLLERKSAERRTRMEQACRLRPGFEYDSDTWSIIYSGCLIITDPALYGFEFATLREPFWSWALRRENQLDGTARYEFTNDVCAVIDAEDLRAMGVLMGADELFLAYRQANRPADPQFTNIKRAAKPIDLEKRRKDEQDKRIVTALEMQYLVRAPLDQRLLF